jgi:ribosomal protein L30/L7E
MKHIPSRLISVLVALAIVVSAVPMPSMASTSLSSQTAGMILLQVEQNGEAWYVNPATLTRYALGRPDDAFEVMRSLGLGISNADLALIPAAGSGTSGSASTASRLSGQILLQVESNGEAWYVYPKTLERTYLGRPEDALATMSALGLGISDADIATIPVAGTPTTEASHVEKTVSTSRGSFTIDLVTIPRESYEMVTDTAETDDCENGCATKSLADYVSENGGTIGIHGTYFCPADYSSCSGMTGTFDPPVYNTAAGRMLNEFDLPYHSGPMLTTNEDGTLWFYHRATDFGTSVASYESASGKQLQSAIANYPSLVEGGENIIASEIVNASQSTKSSRGGIGFDGENFYLVIAHSASVTDLASIFDEAIGADYAMNLDGGATSALYFEGSYAYGPSRTLANAIVFRHK